MAIGTQLLLPVHWYFWALLAACLAAIICLCALWRRRNIWMCCHDYGQDRRSEPDSNGSCYAPPQYSRCSSFHHAPPPYSEVTTKPDMYPLVISYTMGCDGNNVKTPPASFLMVQYFRNYIYQPAESLSAASTVDSLNSSFIYNVNNEANTIIPPAYSCTGSLDECTMPENDLNLTVPKPEQQITNHIFRSRSTSPSEHSELKCQADISRPHYLQATSSVLHHSKISCNDNNSYLHQSQDSQSALSAHNSHCSNPRSPSIGEIVSKTNKDVFLPGSKSFVNNLCKSQTTNGFLVEQSNLNTNENAIHVQNLSKKCDNKNTCVEESLISTAEPDDIRHDSSNTKHQRSSKSSNPPSHHLSEFSSHIDFDPQNSLDRSYSVANSITGSDISSLANLGTPDSPPRATSPTIEIRELLDKIQQLPHPTDEMSTIGTPVSTPSTSKTQVPLRTKRYFMRNKIKTMYMPLSKTKQSSNKNIFESSSKSKNWLSRSAPTTPCTNFIPTFPAQRKGSNHGSRRESKLDDASPLLLENDNSDDDRKPECV